MEGEGGNEDQREASGGVRAKDPSARGERATRWTHRPPREDVSHRATENTEDAQRRTLAQ